MNAQLVFSLVFALGAIVAYPEIALKLLLLWITIIAVKLIW